MRRPLIGALVVALLAFGCAGKKPIIPPEKLWGEGEDAFNTEAYELAVDRYKKLLDQHPFDQHAEEAELKIALVLQGAALGRGDRRLRRLRAHAPDQHGADRGRIPPRHG